MHNIEVQYDCMRVPLYAPKETACVFQKKGCMRGGGGAVEGVPDKILKIDVFKPIS